MVYDCARDMLSLVLGTFNSLSPFRFWCTGISALLHPNMAKCINFESSRN